VEDLTIFQVSDSGERKAVKGNLALPEHGLLLSAEHEAKVTQG
jgi:hypothetical protein